MPRRPGPRPQSAAVIALHGNASKLSAEEIAARQEAERSTPKPRPLRLDTPPELSKYAAECWKLHAPELERLALLSSIDVGAFALACETYAIARHALEEMRPTKADGSPDERKKGLAVLDIDRVHGGQQKRHSGVMVFMQAAREYRSWAVEFGLTPSSRLGLRPAAGAPGPSRGGEGESDEDDGAFFGT